MNISEASAVNTILDRALGKANPIQYGRPSDERYLEAMAYLADRANKALMAGWTGDQVRGVFPLVPA